MLELYQRAWKVGEKLVPELTRADLNSVADSVPTAELLKSLIEHAERVLETYEYGAKPVKDEETLKATAELLVILQKHTFDSVEFTEEEDLLVEDFIARLSVATKGEPSRSILEKRTSTTSNLEIIRGMASAAAQLVEISDAA